MREFALIFLALAAVVVAAIFIVDAAWEHEDNNCLKRHGHLYHEGRTALCLSADGRVIE